MNVYTEMLEVIIREMNAALSSGKKDVVDSDYAQWLSFLKKVHPHSDLLKDHILLADADFNKPLSVMSARGILLLAASLGYPTWYVQPKFKTSAFLDYAHGKFIANDDENMKGAPQFIESFTGRVGGTRVRDGTFLATDIDRNMDFRRKVEFLDTAGFRTAEYVLFPTERLVTMNSDALSTFLRNYISKAREEGLNVDGAVIISDAPIVSDHGYSATRIAYVSEELISNE